ncbi:hypothetical protein J3R30DRAFT_230610 [Lentinula aciculospora]|uniref:Uncharacterized protein n=1 Tax=Lentinula aciculospora TaxID=153920 RepID=A0A9W9AAI9_9AGAR|nr:hypothetical protein J3R30DRAFT_230610 [Lentinula aciculospora]
MISCDLSSISMRRRASAPASLYDLSVHPISSRPLSRLSTTNSPPLMIQESRMAVDVYVAPETKYSSEFPVAPSLKRFSHFPDREFESHKPWQVALNMHIKNFKARAFLADGSIVPRQLSEDGHTIQGDSNEYLISNAWKHPYPSSWLEMDTDESFEMGDDNVDCGSVDQSDSQSEMLYESDGVVEDCSVKEFTMIKDAMDTNKPLPHTPIDFSKILLFRQIHSAVRPVIRRTLSHPVPQHTQAPYSMPLTTRIATTSLYSDKPVQRPSMYQAGVPLSRISERAEEPMNAQESNKSEVPAQSPFDVPQGSAPQWGRSSFPSNVTFLPSLKRSSSSMRSLESFWDHKFGRSDSGVDTTTKGKGRKRSRLFRSFKHLDSVREEPDLDEILTPEPAIVPPSPFSIDEIPNAAETTQATYVRLLNEEGTSISFGTIVSGADTIDGGEKVRTIVCFIRHFLCPLCQDYMYSIARNVDPKALEHAGLRLVIVGNGGWQMIKSYRRIFKLPYPVYTDPTATLYTALGMTMRTLDPGPKEPPLSSSSSSITESVKTGSETYVRHRSLLSGISLVLRNAVKARMPVWRYMGDKALLGGEFVFEKAPGKDVTCVWAHRMQFTTAHKEIGHVIGEAQMYTSDTRSCSDAECSGSFITAMTSLSRISSFSGVTIDQETLAREMGFVDTSTSDLTELSLRDYDSTASRNVSSIYSSSTSQSSSISTWKKLRERELWSLRERNRWSRMIGMLGRSLDTVDSSGGNRLSHHLEVEIPEIAGDTKDERDVFERWFNMLRCATDN